MKKNLQKEDIQKLVLGSLMFLGVIYGYFDILLFPLQKRQVNTATSINALDPEIDKARSALKRATAVEADAPQARANVAQIDALIPEGAPVAWFPVLISEFFKQAGFEKTVTRMNNEFVEKDLPGYRRVSWGIDVPRVDCLGFANAVAGLENAEPLIEIQAMTIESMRDDPEGQHVFLTVNSIVKQ